MGNLSGPFGFSLVSPPADRLVRDGEIFRRRASNGTCWKRRAIPSGHVVYLWKGSSPWIAVRR